jgi:hypothetical protein
MGKKVFVSYSHMQADWVCSSLIPCLRAGGVEVLIDEERFEAGRSVEREMDRFQDRADASILVLSPDYLKSTACIHEMKRAVSRDPDFRRGITIPVIVLPCPLPSEPNLSAALYVDLTDRMDAAQWAFLLDATGARLGTDAPTWLATRDLLRRHLSRNESVNLVVSGSPKWKEMMLHLTQDYFRDLAAVDLLKGSTVSRQGLVREILSSLGATVDVPREPEDLAVLDRVLAARNISRLCLFHMDQIAHRQHYGIDLFSAFRYLIEIRKLVLILQSRTHVVSLLPQDHPLSSISLETVLLRGQPV